MSAPALLRVDPTRDARWATLASSPGGSLFTSPPWIGAVCGTYGFTPMAALVVDGSRGAVAGLPWVDVDDLRGARRLALPFSDRADPIAPDAAAWSVIAAEALAGGLPLTLRCLDGSPAEADRRFTMRGEAAWHETPLGGSVEQLHRRLNPATRRNIATAERAGVTVVLSAEAEAVDEFHRLHVRLRKYKYGLLAQPHEFFHRIWATFAPSNSIVTALALVEGESVAGAVYLMWQDVIYYKFGASSAAHLGRRPNDAVHWAVIQWAIERGLRALDWGLSDLDQPGLVAYKRKWASVERRIQTLNVGGTPIGRSADTERTLSALTRLLTCNGVPDEITAEAGAILYRYFC